MIRVQYRKQVTKPSFKVGAVGEVRELMDHIAINLIRSNHAIATEDQPRRQSRQRVVRAYPAVEIVEQPRVVRTYPPANIVERKRTVRAYSPARKPAKKRTVKQKKEKKSNGHTDKRPDPAGE